MQRSRQSKHKVLESTKIMYATVTSVQIKPGQMTEFLQIWNSAIYPLVRSLPGVVGGYVLTNQHLNKAVAFILYQTKAQAIATQTSGKFRETLLLAAPTAMLETVVREAFEVNIQI